MINVDDVMLVPIAVAGEPAVAVAIAHGNYKDNGCAIASAAAIAAAEAELSTKFLGEADVGPALRRALFAADARVREAAKGRVPDARFLATAVTIRKNLSGIGASMLAAVVTSRHVFVAHVGECHALLVEPGQPPRRLTRAHTLASTPEGRALIAEDPSRRADFESILLRVVGFDGVQVELTRAPFPEGARLVIGNPSVAEVVDFAGRSALQIADGLVPGHLPITLAIVGDAAS